MLLYGWKLIEHWVLLYFQVCSNSAYPQHSRERYRNNSPLVTLYRLNSCLLPGQDMWNSIVSLPFHLRFRYFAILWWLLIWIMITWILKPCYTVSDICKIFDIFHKITRSTCFMKLCTLSLVALIMTITLTLSLISDFGCGAGWHTLWLVWWLRLVWEGKSRTTTTSCRKGREMNILVYFVSFIWPYINFRQFFVMCPFITNMISVISCWHKHDNLREKII